MPGDVSPTPQRGDCMGENGALKESSSKQESLHCVGYVESGESVPCESDEPGRFMYTVKLADPEPGDPGEPPAKPGEPQQTWK